MMNRFKSMLALGVAVTVLAACSKDKDQPIVVPPPSDGSTLTLNGLIGAEAGSSAGNSVYVDFSANKQTAVDRDSWDLGFYSGADFKVILNATNGSSVIKVEKTDLNAVTAADFDPNNLKVGQGGGTFALIDDPREANILNKTAIGVVSATDAENKVYIVNRKGGANNVLATTDLFKIRILRKGTGYTLQYAKVGDATFKTLDIAKNTAANFQFASLVKGAAVSVEPERASWDIVWGYSMYYTATFPYAFSDLVFINNLGGVTAAAVATSSKTYAAFGEADVASVTFSNARDIIGSTWRNTTGAAIGVKTDIFYVVKDSAGNVYKLKFNSFISNDGGERGKPVIEYKLVKKG
ncbi:HmuY family protein [Pedobacter sp. KR3-3]|uniref:HmuY family protein n=1 Tax=Pedobacter albus TaxID=3113905 RepID=A0ABU7I6W3_9SPHI|nr:HmuY family protein [Pedobacter sp. KR3-3]MEE1945213.1 HmuY family protein [Pedobacter sp. KR3-3]